MPRLSFTAAVERPLPNDSRYACPTPRSDEFLSLWSPILLPRRTTTFLESMQNDESDSTSPTMLARLSSTFYFRRAHQSRTRARPKPRLSLYPLPRCLSTPFRRDSRVNTYIQQQHHPAFANENELNIVPFRRTGQTRSHACVAHAPTCTATGGHGTTAPVARGRMSHRRATTFTLRTPNDRRWRRGAWAEIWKSTQAPDEVVCVSTETRKDSEVYRC